MYKEVLKDGKKFHQFQEWIEERIKKTLHYWDEYIDRVDTLNDDEGYSFGSGVRDLGM